MRIRMLAAVVTMLGIGSVVAAQDVPAPPGQLVDVGGRRLHVICTGTGRPTVILEAGASSFAIDWALVQPAVSRTTRVCSYDRAGYGWSDPAPYDMRGDDAMQTLHAALDALGEKAPFVLVGQSMGSRFVRLFARRYPAEVVGMVLVDGEHEDGLFMGIDGKPVAISSLTDAEFDAAWKPPSGPIQLPPVALQPAHSKLPADQQAVRLSLERRLQDAIRSATPESMSRTAHSEHTALMTLHRIDTTEPHPLNDLPLIVLTRGVNSGPRWRTWQADLTRLSTKGAQIVVDDSDHEIHLFRPDVVIKAIQDVQASAAGPR